MNVTKEKAYAKINLTLDVLGKQSTGYHEMEMIMQQIDLYDQIIIEDSEVFQMTSSSKELPLKEDNLVFKAYKQMQEISKIEKPVHIHIEKNIPIAAGLAGGSADAAATYLALNRHWKMDLSLDELIKLGVQIGADIPFCLFGKTALAQGIGEKLTRISSFKDYSILIVNPGYGVSTPKIFQNLDLQNIKKRPNTKLALESIDSGNLELLIQSMHNVLGDVTTRIHKDLIDIIDEIESNKALKAMVSGSGPTVFGIFENEDTAQIAYESMKNKYPIVIISKTI